MRTALRALALVLIASVAYADTIPLPPASAGGGGGPLGGTTEDPSITYVADETNDFAIGGTDSSAVFHFDRGTGLFSINVAGGGMSVAAPTAVGSSLLFKEAANSGSDTMAILAPIDLVGAQDCQLTSGGLFPNACLAGGVDLTTLTDSSDASGLHEHATMTGNVSVIGNEVKITHASLMSELILDGNGVVFSGSLRFFELGAQEWVVAVETSTDDLTFRNASGAVVRIDDTAPSDAFRVRTDRIDASTIPLEIPNSTTLPLTCVVGTVYGDTDAAAPLCLCTATDTWTCGGGVVGQTAAVVHPVSATADLAVGGTDASAAFFLDESSGTLNINVAGGSIEIQAHATDGGAVSLKEGADDGTDTWALKVPDSGLTASVVCDVDADGRIPVECLEATVVLTTGSSLAVTAPLAHGCRFWTNDGEAGNVTVTLPAATVGMCVQFQDVEAVGTINIDPNGTDSILALTNAAGDSIESNSVLLDSIELVAYSAGNWTPRGQRGVWSDAD